MTYQTASQYAQSEFVAINTDWSTLDQSCKTQRVEAMLKESLDMIDDAELFTESIDEVYPTYSSEIAKLDSVTDASSFVASVLSQFEPVRF